jgi:hypothetical protein
MLRYSLKRYIEVLNGKVIDTTLLLPHVECYYVNDGKLYVEHTDGTNFYLGKIVKETNDLVDLTTPLEFEEQK